MNQGVEVNRLQFAILQQREALEKLWSIQRQGAEECKQRTNCQPSSGTGEEKEKRIPQ